MIPTTSAIAAAKAKRDHLRKHGGGAGDDSGFISLDVARMPSKKGESRLVREEDEIGEGEDGKFTTRRSQACCRCIDVVFLDHPEYTGAQETIPLGRKATKARAKQQRENMVELIDEAEDDAFEDEEGKAWEEAQIRRAAHTRTEEPAETRRVYRAAPSQCFYWSLGSFLVAEPSVVVPQPSTLPSLKFVQARLSNSYSALERSHNEHLAVLENCDKERAELDRQETDVRQQVATTSERFDWFVDFKEWVEDVANFLENKVCCFLPRAFLCLPC
jgi:GC-rich sequence DNA-binding factor